MAGRIFKILSRIVDVLLAFFLLVIVAGFLVRIAGIDTYVVMSGSMEPAIRTGSLCFVNTNAAYSDVKAGDIIAYRSFGNVLVTHRAVAVTSEGIETKGDNNDISDGITVTEHNFVGKTIAAIPYLGYAVWELSLLQGKAFLFILAVVIGLLYLILKTIAGKDEEGGQKPPLIANERRQEHGKWL